MNGGSRGGSRGYGQGFDDGYDPRGGRMGTADAFERPEIRDAQVIMEKMSIPKQAFIDPWRECGMQLRKPNGEVTADGLLMAPEPGRPQVSVASRRTDIPNAVAWLKSTIDAEHRDALAEAEANAAKAKEVTPAGAAHPHLGTLSLNGHQYTAARKSSQYYGMMTRGFSEEQKRQYLVSGERGRRFAAVKHAPTDTLGLGKPLGAQPGPLSTTHAKYRTAPANPWPKLATDPPRADSGPGDTGPHTFDPWNAGRWGGLTHHLSKPGGPETR